MVEFRIGKTGKQILKYCKKHGEISIGALIWDLYECRDDEPVNDASDYREYNMDKFLKLTFSQKVSLYNAVRRLEKRKLLESNMVYDRWGHNHANYIEKYIKLTELGEKYVSKHLVNHEIGHD